MSATTLARAAVVALVTAATGLAAPAVSAAPSTTSGTMMYRDFFSNPVDPGWTFYNRAGEIRGGRLWIDGGYLPASTARNGWALTHVGDTAWLDYTLSVSYDTTNLGGSPPVPSAMFFVRNAAQRGGGPAGTTYLVLVFDVGAGNPTPECGPISRPLAKGLVQLIKVVDEALVWSDTRCVSGSVSGTNLAGVTAEAGTISVRINGIQVLRHVDPDPIPYGGVGVGQIWETNGAFDDVRVWAR